MKISKHFNERDYFDGIRMKVEEMLAQGWELKRIANEIQDDWKVFKYFPMSPSQFVEFVSRDYRKVSSFGQHVFISYPEINMIKNVGNIKEIGNRGQQIYYSLLILNKLAKTRESWEPLEYSFKQLLKYTEKIKSDATIREKLYNLNENKIVKTWFKRDNFDRIIFITIHFAKFPETFAPLKNETGDKINSEIILSAANRRWSEELSANLWTKFNKFIDHFPVPATYVPHPSNPFIHVGQNGVMVYKDFLHFSSIFGALNLRGFFPSEHIRRKHKKLAFQQIKEATKSIQYTKPLQTDNAHNMLLENFSQNQDKIFGEGLQINVPKLKILISEMKEKFNRPDEYPRLVKTLEYFENSGSGVYYPRYRPHNATTGRSYAITPDITMLPKKYQKFVQPRNGNIFLSLDIKAAEVSLLGIEANDAQINNMLLKGIDPFSQWSEKIGIARNDIKGIIARYIGGAKLPTMEIDVKGRDQISFIENLEKTHGNFVDHIKRAKKFMEVYGTSMLSPLGYRALPSSPPKYTYAGASIYAQLCIAEICTAWLLEFFACTTKDGSVSQIRLFNHDEIIVEIQDKDSAVIAVTEIGLKSFYTVIAGLYLGNPSMHNFSVQCKTMKYLGDPEAIDLHLSSIKSKKGFLSNDFSEKIFPWNRNFLKSHHSKLKNCTIN